jgi:aminoglycoside phosphotransferase (APT) family kinase protein
VPPQTETTLVHGDFHLRNVITAPTSGEVAAVLDWELATLGDPIADVGTLMGYWPEPGEVTGWEAPETLEGFPARRELADMYFSKTGRDPAHLSYWHALALWKIAIIAEGVLRRARDSPENRAVSGTPVTDMIDAVISRANEVAAEAGM